MKQLFNFYLEDCDKNAAIDKLKRLKGGTTKGQLASLLRVMLKQFLLTPDAQISKDLLEAIDAEYTYSQLKNKRSQL